MVVSSILEPNWNDVGVGDMVDFLAECIIHDPMGRKHLLKSVIHRRFIMVEGVLPRSFACSILQGCVVDTTGGVKVKIEETSEILVHPISDLGDVSAIVELCAGIGVMSDGLISAGGNIICRNELRQPFVQFQQQQGISNIVLGDIGDYKTIKQVFDSSSKSSMVVAGFSCQPWSKLGDGKRFGDARSSSLLFVLRYAFFSRAHSVMLECVQEAGKDVDVQNILQEFCKITGFKMKTVNLALENFWPSKRARWWCMLVNPAFPMDDLRPLPHQKTPPVVASLFPWFPTWTTAEEEQLALDLYETNKFIEFNSFDNAVIKGDQPLSTALHGWGNQLQGCPCGCRSFSMDHNRLRSKGIYAALVILEGFIECVDGPRVKSRHIHPFELSVLSGAFPIKTWMPNLKLSLCGLGQMASPIQSTWVYGQFMYSVGRFFGLDHVDTPEMILWNHVQKVLDSFQRSFPLVFEHESVAKFISDTHDLLFCGHMDRIVPTPLLHEAPKGEQLGLIQIDNTAHAEHDTTVALSEDGYIAIDDHAELDSWKCPFNDCFICDSTKSVIPMELPNHEHPHLEISPTIPFSVQEIPHAEGVNPPQPQDEVMGVPYNSKGGLLAFSKKRLHDEVNSSASVSEVCISKHDPLKVPHREVDTESLHPFANVPRESSDSPPDECFPGDSFTQSVMANIWDIEKVADAGFDSQQGICPTSANERPSHFVQIFYPGDSRPSFVKVARDAAIGSIQVAEDKIGSVVQPTRPNNAVGVPFPIASTTVPFQQIFLRQVSSYRQPKCGESEGPFWDFDCNQIVPRIDVLFQQEGWVAKDEMDFYLTFIQKSNVGEIVPSLTELRDECVVIEWWSRCTLEAKNGPVASAICCHHHWIPVVVTQFEDGIQTFTTNEGRHILETFLHVDRRSIVSLTTPQIFHADCGFQAIGVIIQSLTDLGTTECKSTKRSIPVDAKTAVAWRRLFEHHLLVSGKATQMVRVGDIVLGGAKTGTPEEQIQDLLLSHGVPSDLVKERSENVLTRLGRGKVLTALRSHRPWAEMKAICNEISPKVQLVLPSELESLIKSRVAKSDVFGDKTKKKKQKEKIDSRVVLAPSDITIPDGIFKQGCDELVKQIPLQSIGQDASGIVVLTSREATPYLKLSKPITKKGLAILILDHSHPSCQGLGHVLRFPCRCEQSGEPIIATARLIQLGCHEITRNVPVSPTSVEEVQTSVIRILLYRDECNTSWSDIIQRPVKFVLQQLNLEPSSNGNPVVDVWDRQFLDLKLTKAKPALSELFMVSVRIQGNSHPLVMQSGSNGIYAEPRSYDGRSPDSSFRVIWLSKVDKATAITAMQSTQGETSLTRSGIRFGLRTISSNAEAIHTQHKANIPYLDTSSVLKYVAGPFPYGVTKDGLAKLFGEWGWKARPIQPRGRSGDGAGIQWEIQAECPPESEVYSMKHGDIIISEVGKKKVSEAVKSDVLASAKTLAMLRNTKPTSVVASSSQEDPFETNDPWASWKPSGKFHRVNAGSDSVHPPPNNLESITANFDRKLAETVAQIDQKIASRDVSDVSMGDVPDKRLDQVETRLQQLETSLQHQQISHQQHQTQVAQKFQQVEQQMEAQTRAYQSHLDSKMSEQLAQIEILLGKRARHE